MIGRKYTVLIPEIAHTTARTLARLTAPADRVLLIEEIKLQALGANPANENLHILLSQTTQAGAGGNAAPSVNPYDQGDPAFGGTAAVVDADGWTTDPNSGTLITKDDGTPFNRQGGYLWTYTDHGGPIIVRGQTNFIVQFGTAPPTSVSVRGAIVFREVG